MAFSIYVLYGDPAGENVQDLAAMSSKSNASTVIVCPPIRPACLTPLCGIPNRRNLPAATRRPCHPRLASGQIKAMTGVTFIWRRKRRDGARMDYTPYADGSESPSHASPGLRLADFVAGVIWRRYGMRMKGIADFLIPCGSVTETVMESVGTAQYYKDKDTMTSKGVRPAEF